jgi:hypothetical protein
MKVCISFGFFNLEFTISLIIYVFCYLYEIFIVDDFFESSNSKLLDPLLYYFGHILCFIPVLIENKISKKTERTGNQLEGINNSFIDYIYNNPYERNLETRDIFFILFICLLNIIDEFCLIFEDLIISNLKKEDDPRKVYLKNNYFFIEVLIWFFFLNIF